jgi:membrane fusion protein (multidrug efflux system)
MTEDTSAKTWNAYTVIAVFVVAAIAIISIVFFVFHPGYETTDDAQIDGHIHPIGARIAGTVVWVNPEVEDTHFVKGGTVVARLDPNDYRPTVDRLRGDAESSEAQWKSSRLNLPIVAASASTHLEAARAAVREVEADLRTAVAQHDAAEASVRQVMASYERAEDDRLRYEALLQTHDISKSEYEQRATEARSLREQLETARAVAVSSRERIASTEERLAQRKSELEDAETAPQRIAVAASGVHRTAGDLTRARAALQTANLDLSYTEIIAPIDGIVGRRSIEVGQHISGGQILFTLVAPNDIWATANFRETQLRHMRTRQPARLHVDSYGQDFTGTVESFGGATGSKYSVIAPDNATGNFVKVVQRVPVRIRIDPVNLDGRPLLPGMSLEVSVKTGE